MLFPYENERLTSMVPAERAARLERYLHERQLPPVSLGFSYIAYAVLLLTVHADMDTDRLTAETAREFGTEPAQVQRSMLYAVLTGWQYSGGTKQSVPEFIQTAAEWLLAQE